MNALAMRTEAPFPTNYVEKINYPNTFWDKVWPSKAVQIYNSNPNDCTNVVNALNLSESEDKWKFELVHAKALYLIGDYANSLKISNQVLADLHPEALLLKTCTLFQLQKYDQVYLLALEILQINKEDPFSTQIIQAIQSLVKPDACLTHTEISVTIRYNPGFSQLLKDKAAEGNSNAEFNLGQCYEDGIGVDRDFQRAFECYQRSANQGNSYGMWKLGFCYQEGIGVAKDLKRAIELYHQSADQGNAYGEYQLGSCFLRGNGIDVDQAKAFHYFQKSANQGNSYGQFGLGLCYLRGAGVETDFQKGVQLLQNSADQENPLGLYTLGICYYNGNCVEPHYPKAMHYLKKSSELGFSLADNYLKYIKSHSIEGFVRMFFGLEP